MPSNLIDNAPRPWSNSQHRCTPTLDLRPSRIMDNLRFKSQTQRLRL